MDFNEEQIERYSRHIILKDIGVEGQMLISQSSVLVVGAGGLGSPALLYLAAAGVGKIGIADNDVLDISNLQRQVIHSTPDLNRPKTQSAKDSIIAMNPHVKVEAIQCELKADNILPFIQEYDFIIDGTDNFPSKFLINDACVLAGKPFSHGGVLEYFGQTITVIPRESTCYRCFMIEPPPPGAIPTCAQAGVLGVVPGIIGLIQATECLKSILGKGDLLLNRILIYDALEMSFREIKATRNKKCPICGENPSITDLKDYDRRVCADNSVE